MNSRGIIAAISWNFLEQLLKRSASIITTLILANLLSPNQFGVVAIVTVILTIAFGIIDGGLRQALIRVNSNIAYLDTAFTFNFTMAVMLYISLYASAPLISDFYNSPELTDLLRIMSISLFFYALEPTQLAIHSKSLDFKKIAYASFPAALVSSGAGIILALFGAGIWALAAQFIINTAIFSLILRRASTEPPKLRFSYSAFKELFSFAGKLLFSNTSDAIFQNYYLLVITKIASTTTAGHFFFANKIKDFTLSLLMSSIQTATFSAHAQLNKDKLRSVSIQTLRLTTFILFPILVTAVLFSNNIFSALLPRQWWPASGYFQIIILGSLLYPAHITNLNALKILGTANELVKIDIIKKLSSLLTLLFTYQHGVISIIAGQSCVNLLAIIPNSWHSKRLIEYSFLTQLRDVIPNLLLAILSATLCYNTFSYFGESTNALLTFSIASSFIIYIFMSAAFGTISFNEFKIFILKRVRNNNES